MKGVLSGKLYNRSILCHKMVYEAMQRLPFEAFLQSLDHDEKEGLELAVLDIIESFPDQEFVDRPDRNGSNQ